MLCLYIQCLSANESAPPYLGKERNLCPHYNFFPTAPYSISLSLITIPSPVAPHSSCQVIYYQLHLFRGNKGGRRATKKTNLFNHKLFFRSQQQRFRDFGKGLAERKESSLWAENCVALSSFYSFLLICHRMEFIFFSSGRAPVLLR